jgi:hypothetical protein
MVAQELGGIALGLLRDAGQIEGHIVVTRKGLLYQERLAGLAGS